MTVSATLHRVAAVDGKPQPMDHDPDLGRLSVEDTHGNRVTIFMPACAAIAMADAYRAALSAPAQVAAE